MLVPLAHDANQPTATATIVDVNSPTGTGTRRVLEATRAWVGNGLANCAHASGTRWAVASYPFGVSAERPADPNSGAAACAFITIPLDIAKGSIIELDGRPVDAGWFAPHDDTLLPRIRERMSKLGIGGAVVASEARPDPRAPFERFRWRLGVALRGWEEPPPLEGVAQLAALQSESIWLAALARIDRVSPGTACEIAEQLVATVVDLERNHQVAAWISDPDELNALIAMMLDTSKSDAEAVESVLTWNRVRAPVFIWTEREDDHAITLAFANPTAAELLLPMQWLGALEPSVAALLQPGTLERLRVALPTKDGSSISGLVPGTELGSAILSIQCQGEEKRLPFRIRATSANVPGIALRPFLAPLDLKSVATGTRTAAPSALQSEAHLRERNTGWELLLICRNEIGCDPMRDRVVIHAGESGTVTVFASGLVECTGATTSAVSSRVEVRQFQGEWRASLQVPAEWIADTGVERLLRIGFRRVVDEQSADAPTACAPWNPLPITVSMQLKAS